MFNGELEMINGGFEEFIKYKIHYHGFHTILRRRNEIVWVF